MVQFEYVATLKEVRVIILFPLVAEVVLEEQEPPYVIVPASSEENVSSGVVSLVGVVTAVTSAITGAMVSITNELIFNVTLLLELSVTVIVQFEYVPSLKETKVIVLFPEIAEVVLEEQEPPYAMVPTSSEEKV
jgi:hypothetical protein